jgi:hypothetical protein
LGGILDWGGGYQLSRFTYEMTFMKKLQIQMNGRSDEFGTPHIAFNILKPYIPDHWVIWEYAYGKGSLAKIMETQGYSVVSSSNFFEDSQDCDVIITNPPYSLKEAFLERAYSLDKPFAFLMPLTALEGKKRGLLYRKYGIELIIPNKRINFVTPSGKGSGAWFQVAWFCWRLDLPKQLNFVDLQATQELFI